MERRVEGGREVYGEKSGGSEGRVWREEWREGGKCMERRVEGVRDVYGEKSGGSEGRVWRK